jgi:hypothetical protein
LVIHHSASESRSPRVWNIIRDYHVEDKGWDDIGYHFGVVPIEGVWEVLVGRPLNMHGAHTAGYNQKAIGVCFVGNYDLHPPPNAALDTAVPTLRWLVDFFDIPEEYFVGHNAFADTLCPGRYFPMPQLRREVYHG